MQFPSKTTTINILRMASLVGAFGLAVALSTGPGKALAAPLDNGAGKSTKKNLPRRLAGHEGAVQGLAFSPDGTYLVVGARSDRAVVVWDLTTGKLRYELPSREGGTKAEGLPWHTGPVAAAYSPDGAMIATACGGNPSEKEGAGRILLWDAKSGKFIREIRAHRFRVFAVAFSPDGKQLVSGGYDDTGKVWDIASGKQVQQFLLDSRSDKVIAVAFSPDGKSVFLASQKGELLQGEVGSGRVLARLSRIGYRSPSPFHLTAGGKQLLCFEVGADNYVYSYALPGWKKRTAWRQPRVELSSPSVSLWTAPPDGKLLALVQTDRVTVWSLVTGKYLLPLAQGEPISHITTLAFSPDGKTLAAGLLSSRSILLWDISRPRLDALWAEVAIRNDTEAKDYVADLAALPKEAVPYLAERLQKLAKIEEQVRKIAAGLDDDNFEARQTASRQLKALGSGAQFGLERVLENKPSAEVRKRVEPLLAPPAPPPIDPKKLSKMEYTLWLQGKWPPKAPEAPKPSEGRALKRAFAALEKMGTAEARRAVKELAETAPDGLVREEAKASLGRLSKAGSPRP